MLEPDSRTRTPLQSVTAEGETEEEKWGWNQQHMRGKSAMTTAVTAFLMQACRDCFKTSPPWGALGNYLINPLINIQNSYSKDSRCQSLQTHNHFHYALFYPPLMWLVNRSATEWMQWAQCFWAVFSPPLCVCVVKTPLAPLCDPVSHN